VGDFYGTGIEIWAGFGPVWQLLRPVFSCFHGQKKNLKNIADGENKSGIARTYLQLPLRQWGAGNVYLLVL
jgi:hypothetical protein